jgi:hypothetical protein
MSLKDLRIGGIYIVLFIRDAVLAKNDFHWALYHHYHSDDGGTKYHIRSIGDGWIAEHGITKGVLKSFLLIGLFQIATVPSSSVGTVDSIMKTYDSIVV